MFNALHLTSDSSNRADQHNTRVAGCLLLLQHWCPRDVPQAEMTSQRGGINRDSYVQDARSTLPPSYLLIQEYHTNTHHHGTIATPSLPLSTHSRACKYKLAYNFSAICLACTHILLLSCPLPHSLAPSLSRSIYLLCLGLVQVAGGAANGWPRSLGARVPVAGLRGAGPPWLRSTTSRAGSWPAADPQPRPRGALAHPLTPAPSCSAALPSLCNRVLLPAAPWGFRPPLPSSPSPTPPAPKLLSRGSSGDRLSPLGRHAPRRPHAPRGARGCAGPRKSRGRGPEAPSLACLTSWRCTASSDSPQQRSRCRDPPSGRDFPPGPPGGGQGGKKWPEAPARGCAALPANFCLGFHRSVTFRSRTCLERLGKCPDGPRKEMMQFNEDIPLGSF